MRLSKGTSTENPWCFSPFTSQDHPVQKRDIAQHNAAMLSSKAGSAARPWPAQSHVHPEKPGISGSVSLHLKSQKMWDSSKHGARSGFCSTAGYQSTHKKSEFWVIASGSQASEWNAHLMPTSALFFSFPNFYYSRLTWTQKRTKHPQNRVPKPFWKVVVAFPKRGHPKNWWLRENPAKMDDNWGYSHDLGHHQLSSGCINQTHGTNGHVLRSWKPL